MPLLSILPNEPSGLPEDIPLPPSPVPNHSQNNEQEQGDKNKTLLSMYLKYAQDQESSTLSQWNADMNILLVFVSFIDACFGRSNVRFLGGTVLELLLYSWSNR